MRSIEWCHFQWPWNGWPLTQISRARHYSTFNITVWTLVQAVLTATFNSYGDRQISTPYKINTPEPIDEKFGTVDYVREGTLYTKFDTNAPTGGFWENEWNITKNYLLFITFFSQARTQVTPVDGFLHAIAQKTWNHARMCLLGVWMMCP